MQHQYPLPCALTLPFTRVRFARRVQGLVSSLVWRAHELPSKIRAEVANYDPCNPQRRNGDHLTKTCPCQ